MDLLPDAWTALWAGAAALVAGGAGAGLVSRLRRRGVRVPYTRKIFHFIVFTSAAGVNLAWALPGTLVFGSLIALLVIAAVVAGEGSGLYEALARDTDRPRRTLFIVVPLVTTAVGGLAAALLAGPYASVGYLATGWGDAVGEPVGARWGKHPYRVPSLAGVPAQRTLEGSAAVFGVSSIAAMLALWSLGAGPDAWWAGLLCGAASAAVEAVSNHGLDNLTVQIAASLAAKALLG